MSLLHVEGLKKVYTTRFGGQQVEALRDVNFEVEEASTSPSWANRAAARRRC